MTADTEAFVRLVRDAITTDTHQFSEVQIAQFAGFLDMLARWNKRIGLTAVDDPAQMVVRHLLDSLSALPWLKGPRVIDVGTGPGLPGLPLAIARPDLEFTLLDSLEKRMIFVRQAIHTLKLTNVTVVTDRAETYRATPEFDTLVTRAYSSLVDMQRTCSHLCRGRLVAMKGRYPDAEIEAFEAKIKDGAAAESGKESLSDRIAVHPVDVPGLKAERHIVVVEPFGAIG